MKSIPRLDVADHARSTAEAWEALRHKVMEILSRAPYACVVRGIGFHTLSDTDRSELVRRTASLFGEVSDNNRFDEESGSFIDEVKPTEPGGTDVTFTLGACEAHSDESSKPFPEDVVMLWCVTPADDGGTSLVWPASELAAYIGDQPDGEDALRVLREPVFLFGGKLRNPPRILQAPVLFGDDGIRFRLGSMEDALEVTGRELTKTQHRALGSLIEALDSVEPYISDLRSGDLLVTLNRRTLHGRTNFTDQKRLLLRTRCFNKEVSNSDRDQASWLIS
ncbi:TauD/TfdA family dioxygenase [Nocardia ignorata]|uniref:TfdA family taurine catabolism dioxygenase TauD n=1 Tax=Nocardia ignorata TaxID=145285 RepID=A0A4R6PIM0_NOCIG|nr:TauD/TfdA family dioxygenase [Nocardia ignorata]TDP37695.1 TfdA family taurine catabolism dioxygenase TauD [Nocardia ignorata]